MVVAASHEALATMRQGRTRVILNTQDTMPGDFTRDADLAFPARRLRDAIERTAGGAQVDIVDATRLATALIGDSIATNLFMVGYACQKGLIPVSIASIEQAIVLNGAAVEANKRAFALGRQAAVDTAALERLAAPPLPKEDSRRPSESLEEMIDRRVAALTAYQSRRYAQRYRRLVDRVRLAEADRGRGLSGLTEAVARNHFKLLAYKDEYEVARLYTDGDFLRKLGEQFEGDYKLSFHLAPPILGRRDRATGEPRKSAFGPWVLRLFRLLARLRFLRGTPLDIFGRTPERRQERQLIRDYESVVSELLDRLDHDRHALALEIARLPEQIRGYGHIKRRSIEKAKAREAALLEAYRTRTAPRVAAE
jgi:indolepyruvate ferredoxin oxidoreductase